MSQVGCASASRGETFRNDSRLRPRNGPPDAVSTSRRTSAAVPDRSAWAMAECSESTGTNWPGAAAPSTSSPPTMRLSLLARARVAPTSSAARDGPRPTEPVMPFSTTSALTDRTSCSASSSPRAICSTPRAAAWASTAARWEPAASPTTSKRSRFAAITSSACTPIDPVEPRMMTRRMGLR